VSWPDPVTAFREIAAGHERMFWLDGGGSRDWSGRRSLIGWLDDDDVSLTYDAARREVSRHTGGGDEIVGEDIFDVLTSEMARDDGDPSVSWVGYLGYACRPDLPALVSTSSTGEASSTGAQRVPEAMWMRVRDPLVFDHPAGSESSGGGPMASQAADNAAEYAEWFDRIQEQLRLGNSYEVNLTYRQQVASAVDPVQAYLRLREINPAPYAGYLQHRGTHVLSSSPERFATIDRHRWVETKPIKGTTPRGDDPEQDERHRHALVTDPRFRAENLMIVDLLRNDLSMVCEPGTVTVPALMQVESYASVHQLVSTVRGRLRPGVSTVEALRALFPAGSMTGAPKLRTMQIIADVETTPRGVYAGALGWVSGDGRADLGVVIRTLVATPHPERGWRYELGTGGGVTVRSDVESEYAETLWKAARLLSAVQ
jgi:para-aminobenzoate synthetase